jgi:hypothetical protein
MRSVFAAISVAVSLASATSVAAQGPYPTGVGSNGQVLPTGSLDPHWFFTAGAATQPSSGQSAYVIPLSPLATMPPWVNPGTTAWWISMLPTGHLHAPDGITTFYTWFVLTGNPFGARLSALLATDNTADIFLNGVLVGSNSAAFNALTPFTVTQGFVPGRNLLAIQLNNLPNNSLNPAGLVVSNIAVSTTPEPLTLGLLASGLVGLGAARRRKRGQPS